MIRRAVTTSLALASVFLPLRAIAQTQPSPYQGQQGREIKALSAEEVEDLLMGRGMGLAKAAELNHHPGPKHVLELAPALDLTQAQRAQVQRA